MAINHVRELIVDLIEEESLEAFHEDCATTDKLFRIMEGTNDPEKAYTTAVAWANSVLTLARTEVRLLAAVLPVCQSELDGLVDKITPLIQRREDAREAVHEFRGPDHDIRPLSMKTDPNRAKGIKKARQYAKDVSVEVLAELRPIQGNADEIQKEIGAIKRSLRVLDHFVRYKFPIPQRKPSLRGQSSSPSGEDPIAAFARKYVANMDKSDAVDKRRVALEKARAHPTNRYDRLGQEQVH